MMVEEHIHQNGFIRKKKLNVGYFGFFLFLYPRGTCLLIYDIFPFLSSIKNTCSHEDIIKILCRDFNIKMELTTDMGTLQTLSGNWGLGTLDQEMSTLFPAVTNVGANDTTIVYICSGISQV